MVGGKSPAKKQPPDRRRGDGCRVPEPFPRDKAHLAAALRYRAVGEKGNKVLQETILVLGHVYSVAKVSLKTRVPEEGHVWLLFVPKFQFSWLVPRLCAIH